MHQELSQIPAYRRRILLIGTAADLSRLRLHKETRRFLVNPSARFLTIDDGVETNDPIVRAIADKGLLQPGILLIQSLSVPDQYMRLSNISDRTAEGKLDVSVRVCQLLGAERVEIRHAEFNTEKSSHSHASDAKAVGLATGDVKTSSNTTKVGSLRVRSSWTFSGGQPQVADADRALAASGLKDEALQSMIDFFRSYNRPKSHEFEISTSEEIQRLREVVSDVSIPATFKAHSDLELFKSSASSYQFELRVDFPTL